MKRFILTLLALCPLLCGVGCKNEYDDSALWKDIDQMYKDLNELRTQITSMQEQLDALSAIAGESGAITSITQDDEGNYTITYKDGDNVEHTINVATQDDVDSEPIIGMQQEDGVWYWTTTVKGTTSWLLDTDGEKIPVTGRTPQIGVDDQGYWTVFGERITDAQGNPVKSEGKAASVITDITVDGGYVTFTLGNGVTVTAQVNDKFNVNFDIEAKTVVTDPASPLVIHYTLVGETETSVLSIEKYEGINEPALDTAAKTITVTFPEGFEQGSLTVMFYDGEDNVIIKPLLFTTLEGEPTGICSAEDLKAFASAVNNGKSLTKYIIDGEVRLMNDIDMSGVDWNEYVIGGVVTPSTTTANKAVTYTAGENRFDKVFNGGGFALKNVDWNFNLADGNISHGLFSFLGSEAEIKNLTIEGTITLTGEAPQGAAAAAFAGYAEGKITGCVNKASIVFEGSDASNVSVRAAGIAAVADNAAITGCTNDGTLTCGRIENTGNGTNSGFHQGGICAFVSGTATLTDCTNNGGISAPSGRGGGIAGVMNGGTMTRCTNNGTVQDDVEGLFGANPSYKRMGGLAGGAAASATLESCVNAGNVFSQLGCRTGGFVGHNEATITACENKGIILSDHTVDGTNKHGSGWACGYNKSATSITGCIIGGRVGNWTDCKDNPESAPAATYATAVRHGAFDPAANGLDDQDDEYYEWTVADEAQLADGVTYTRYDLTNHDSDVYVVTVDLTNPKVVLETVMADEICLNPNHNGNSNNGKNLRETLSETCLRRTSEGRNIVAGVNTGFFESNLGFPRAFHVEYDEPVYINNPYVREAYPAHAPGFTFFEDRSVSFSNRDFTGMVKSGDIEVEYYSVNDTIVALSNKVPLGYEYCQTANLYTSRFKHEPHPGIYNTVNPNALFIVGRSNSELKVNCGYIDGEVTAVVDGRNGAQIEVPFVENRNEWVLQLTGESAEKLASLKAGDPISIKGDVTIGSQTKPIIMYNGSMYRFLNNGAWGNISNNEEKPATILGADQAGTTVKIVCVSGTSSSGTGMNYYQLYRVMSKLGMYNAIRFDGGGSTSMWTKPGGVVCKSSDSKGDERSCMNYMHVRILE